jgi:hypothetical protein
LENTKKESNESSEDDVDDANSMRIQKHLHDSEIGKIMDELMLSQFQMEKLRSRLASKFVQYVHKADVYYSKIDKKELSSLFEFRHGGKMYRISIDVERSNATNIEDDGLV